MGGGSRWCGDGAGRCSGGGTGRMADDSGGCFGAVFGVVLGAQNTWTKYREECMEDGR